MLPDATVVYVVGYFIGVIYVAILGFWLTLKIKGTENVNELWIHPDEIAE